MQIFASFSFYFHFYPSRPFQMGPGKIGETTNQLSLALASKHLKVILFHSSWFEVQGKG